MTAGCRSRWLYGFPDQPQERFAWSDPSVENLESRGDPGIIRLPRKEAY